MSTAQPLPRNAAATPDVIDCVEPATLASLGSVPVDGPDAVRDAVARSRVAQENAKANIQRKQNELREVIAQLEAAPREVYCGAIGWVDADRGCGSLNVAIRTFWLDGAELKFGTGAGITWGSDPVGEWRETELKAGRLIGLASADSVKR